eukprot:2577343-Pleurochrysis_carterae.AAC.2
MIKWAATCTCLVTKSRQAWVVEGGEMELGCTVKRGGRRWKRRQSVAERGRKRGRDRRTRRERGREGGRAEERESGQVAKNSCEGPRCAHASPGRIQVPEGARHGTLHDVECSSTSVRQDSSACYPGRHALKSA